MSFRRDAASPRRSTGTRLWPVVLGTVAAVVVLLAAGYASGLARSVVDRAEHALRAAAAKETPAATTPAAPATAHSIGGPSAQAYGTTYALRGHTAGVDGVLATGTVVLSGRWQADGRWSVLARTQTTASGGFEISTKLDRFGTLALRLETPDGLVKTKTLTVR